jgi:hypothetical protein
MSRKFAVEVQIANDDGLPMRGALVSIGKYPIGSTSSDGIIKTEVSGAEGESLPVAVSCPEGFTNPETPTPLKLTHTRRVGLNGYQPTRIEAVCRRNLRDIVLIVRAHGGAGLPVAVEGRSAGVTDADGIAHVLVKADRMTASLRATLETNERPELKPKSPSRTFELAGNDAILVFDQNFVSNPKAVFGSGAPRAKTHVPYRVD